MFHKIFTVYDEKAQAFLPPFFLRAAGEATRAFAECINSASHQFGKYPQDYTLFELGEFDDNTALISCASKQSLGNGVEFLRPDLADDKKDLFNVAPINPDASVQSNKARGNSA